MQAPVHFLTGVLIYRFIKTYFPTFSYVISLIVIIILSILSHFLIDAVAKITYHVPDARPEDRFWLGYHIFIYLLSALMLIVLWIPYWPALLGASLFDIIDWLVLRAILKKEPVLHKYVDRFRKRFFGFLPDLIEKKWTVLNEFIIMGILILGIISI